MKAAVRFRYGPPQVVEVRDVPDPVPTGDQLLVRVRASSVNRADLDGLYPRWQFTRAFLGLRRPRNRWLGLDAAGVVEAVGPDVTRFKPGDRVLADLFPTGVGAFAELVAVPEKFWTRIPDTLSFEDAATLPHAAILALQGLRGRRGRTVRKGDKVLIDGASGNVGPFAVQAAKAMGAEVTGVCRGSKVDFVRSLGADHVIDYETTDYTTGRERYDWILAVDAHHSWWSIRRVLRRGGTYVAEGGSGRWIVSALTYAPLLSLASGRSMGLMLWWKPNNAADYERLFELIAAGQVRPRLDSQFPLSGVVDALRRVDDGQASGKVLVIP